MRSPGPSSTHAYPSTLSYRSTLMRLIAKTVPVPINCLFQTIFSKVLNVRIDIYHIRKLNRVYYIYSGNGMYLGIWQIKLN
jgi:hypothetical protein